MLLRIQHERQTSSHFPSLGEYTSMFGLNKTRASWLNPKAIIMHPGPINRGVEIDSELADSSRSVILEQVQQRPRRPHGRALSLLRRTTRDGHGELINAPTEKRSKLQIPKSKSQNSKSKDQVPRVKIQFFRARFP